MQLNIQCAMTKKKALCLQTNVFRNNAHKKRPGSRLLDDDLETELKLMVAYPLASYLTLQIYLHIMQD